MKLKIFTLAALLSTNTFASDISKLYEKNMMVYFYTSPQNTMFKECVSPSGKLNWKMENTPNELHKMFPSLRLVDAELIKDMDHLVVKYIFDSESNSVNIIGGSFNKIEFNNDVTILQMIHIFCPNIK